MQSLVYILIALAGLGVGAAAYFGLTFTPIEALLATFIFVAVALSLLERTWRRRAEARLERAMADLSELVSADSSARAGLARQVETLTAENAGARLETLEADISVLGTVIRQVAEAVAELEDARRHQAQSPNATPSGSGTAPAAPPETVPASPPAAASQAVVAPAVPPPAAPVSAPAIPLELLKQALEDDRLVVHAQPVVTLPQRRAQGYDLVPRLRLEDGDLADPPDFMPRHGGGAVVRRIERLLLDEAITVARRALTRGQPANLYIPMSRATLGDSLAVEKIIALLEANRAIAGYIVLMVDWQEWQALTSAHRETIADFVRRGVGVSLAGIDSLRLDFLRLAGDGVRSVRLDAARFIDAPESFSDFHSADVTSYLKRFEVDLIATGIHTEQQILTLLEDGIALAQGPHIAGPGPVRPDLAVHRAALETRPRRVEG